MKRNDSGFQESFLLETPHDVPTPTPIVRSNTAPTRRRNPKKSTIDSVISTLPTDMAAVRSASEKKSKPSHQRSKTSSSERSTSRSRGRGHGSKPSSSRTSCTIVDPSRIRHHRIQSSHTFPSANRQDIDDVYALHHRSYSLFQNPSLHTNSGLSSPALSQADHSGWPVGTPRFSVDEAHTIKEHDLPEQSEETITVVKKPCPTMHWTSPCTRRREYERIDKANSGLRGLLNKVVPRCVSGPQEKFYEKDQSDAGSVRRYRMDEEEYLGEKEVARSQVVAAKKTTAVTKKKWICF